MRGAQVHRCLLALAAEQGMHHTGHEGVATADTVEQVYFARVGDIQLRPRAQRTGPPMPGRRGGVAQRERHRLQRRELRHRAHGGCLGWTDIHRRVAATEIAQVHAQACGERILIADQQIAFGGDGAVGVPRGLRVRMAVPEAGAVVEIVGDRHAVPARSTHRRNCRRRAVLGQGGEDPTGMQPAHAVLAEQRVPVEGLRLQLRGRRVRAVGNAQRRTRPETTLGEVQAHAGVAADAIVVAPEDLAGIHATGLDQLLGEQAKLVARQGGEHPGAVFERAAQATRHVVLAAAFPHGELARAADPALAGIEAQHHFAQRQCVPALAVVGCDNEGLGRHRTGHPSRARSMPSAMRR